jgi:hypothetical protein
MQSIKIRIGKETLSRKKCVRKAYWGSRWPVKMFLDHPSKSYEFWKSQVYYLSRNFVFCPPLYCRLCVASRNQLFSRIFSCIFVGSRPETDLIWSKFLLEPGVAEKCAKNLCFLASWPSADQIFLLPGQGVNMNLLRGGEGLTRHSF